MPRQQTASRFRNFVSNTLIDCLLALAVFRDLLNELLGLEYHLSIRRMNNLQKFIFYAGGPHLGLPCWLQKHSNPCFALNAELSMVDTRTQWLCSYRFSSYDYSCKLNLGNNRNLNVAFEVFS
jgi:hypothetical protein